MSGMSLPERRMPRVPAPEDGENRRRRDREAGTGGGNAVSV